jgi:hypothetical protein
MRCNCENSDCTTHRPAHCPNPGTVRCMYVGFICETCAVVIPAEYLIP